MIVLPADFNAAALASDFFTLALPFVKIAVLIGTANLIMNLIRHN